MFCAKNLIGFSYITCQIRLSAWPRLPIHDIRVTLRGYDIARVTIQPEDKVLQVSTKGRESTVVGPRLDVRSIVVVELK